MDICLESFNYTVVNEGLGEKAGKVLDGIFAKFIQFLKNLGEKIAGLFAKLKSKVDGLVKNIQRKDIEAAVNKYFKNPNKYDDITIKYITAYSPIIMRNGGIEKLCTDLLEINDYMDKYFDNYTLSEDKFVATTRMGFLDEWFKDKFGRGTVSSLLNDDPRNEFNNIFEDHANWSESQFKNGAKLSEIVDLDEYNKSELSFAHVDKIEATVKSSIDKFIAKAEKIKAKHKNKEIPTSDMSMLNSYVTNTQFFAEQTFSRVAEYAKNITVIMIACYRVVTKKSKTNGEYYVPSGQFTDTD